jgi:hypothetical protein
LGRKPLDLIGKRFGLLTVLERVIKEDNNDSYWKCMCECGNTCIVTGSNLKSGRTVSCGCVNDKKRREGFKDITGMRFGKLTVISKTSKRINRRVVWYCLCDCGNYCEVSINHIGNNTLSCGCIKTEELLKDCVEDTRLRNLTSKKRARKIKDSGIKGVVWDSRRQKWTAQIGIRGKGIRLGRCDTIEEAAELRAAAEELYFKPILDKYVKKIMAPVHPAEMELI